MKNSIAMTKRRSSEGRMVARSKRNPLIGTYRGQKELMRYRTAQLSQGGEKRLPELTFVGPKRMFNKKCYIISYTITYFKNLKRFAISCFGVSFLPYYIECEHLSNFFFLVSFSISFLLPDFISSHAQQVC